MKQAEVIYHSGVNAYLEDIEKLWVKGIGMNSGITDKASICRYTRLEPLNS